MGVTLQRLDQVESSALAGTIRNAGIAGAGGAGFPTYAKWERLEEVDYLLVNHQESEPNYYIDKWLLREGADELASFLDALLDRAFDTIVVAAKEKDRERWMGEFEAATNASVFTDADLPLDPAAESGIVCAYTDDRYEYGMEGVLLRIVADTVIGTDLPVDHGWIVQNTETLFNLYRTLDAGDPVTRKLVHVDGNVPRHRFLEVPIGTPASKLLEMADLDPDDMADWHVLADGGPGWCFEIEQSPEEFGVRKRTNCVLVLDEKVIWEHTYGDERINVLEPYNWGGDHELEPTTVEVDRVRIPLITNPGFEGVVSPSAPIVDAGETVEAGEMIATPSGEGISNAQHASIDGEISAVTDTHIEITGAPEAVGAAESATIKPGVYWTWCRDCGSYVALPETSGQADPTDYVCTDCR